LNGCHNLHIARAAAEIAGNSRANLLLGGLQIGLQKRYCRQNHARRAVAALPAVVLGKGVLHRMHLARRAYSLNSGHLMAVSLHGKEHAGADEFSIQ
jgi:hypothetical protein